MTAYEAMIKTNHHFIKGGELNEAQKNKILHFLLAEKHGNIRDGRRMKMYPDGPYPKFFIPPYNGGKKMQTVVPFSPKTNIAADNAYEFEMLRLFYLFTPAEERDKINHMLDVTAERLTKTCFGYQSCHYAECFEAGLTVFRFLSFARPHDLAWLDKQLTMYNNHFSDRKRHRGVQHYHWLCLSQMPFDLAKEQIHRQRDLLIEHLSRTYLNKNNADEIPLYVARNTLAQLADFAYIKDRRPFADEKSGRLRFTLE